MRREEVNRYEEPELPSAIFKQALLAIVAAVVLTVVVALIIVHDSSNSDEAKQQPQIEQISSPGHAAR